MDNFPRLGTLTVKRISDIGVVTMLHRLHYSIGERTVRPRKRRVHGRVGANQGRFQMADGGTLFLHEIGDLPLGLQPKLLRVLQERALERMGGTQTVRVNEHNSNLPASVA